MFNLLKISITKLLTKPIKEKDKEREREKEAAIYWKISSPEALVDRQGWKVSLLKGMYATRLPSLIQVLWLKGSRLTYVAKKLMNFVILAK
jgi:hypothetical protein